MRRITLNANQEAWLPWVFLIALALIYLAFPTKNYYWDGVAFAQAIEDAPGIDSSLLHPNHLIYNLVGYIFYRSIRAFGFNIRALSALQILNSVLGAICALILFQILKRALRSVYLATTLTLLFALSATWWKFATDADSYVSSILFLLFSFYLILPGNRSRPFLVALTFSAAMLFHQLAVFFYPVAVAGLLLQSVSKGKQRFLDPLEFTLVSFTMTAAAYCYSYYLITGTFNLHRFVQWITDFSPDVSFSFNLWSNFFYTLRGHFRLFFGGRFNAIAELINPMVIVLMAILAVSFVVFLYKVIRTFPRSLNKPKCHWIASLRRDPQLRALLLLAAIWTFVYLAFLFVWLPQNTFYRLFYLPALILIVGIILATCEQPDPGRRHYRLAWLVTILALLNFLFLIFPYSHTQKHPPLAFALEMNRVWPDHTIVYYGSANSDNSLVRYFNQGTKWKKLELENAQQLEQDLRDATAKGIDMWLETSAIDQLTNSPGGSEWLKSHVNEETQRALVTKAHNIRFVQITPSREQ
ncbi:MAG TPA: hypothetical protein VFR80_08930 [Pyrinomonadaceae bacterium]|nr:hypothetical protein [Pyrinomonadaceae bacterium]